MVIGQLEAITPTSLAHVVAKPKQTKTLCCQHQSGPRFSEFRASVLPAGKQNGMTELQRFSCLKIVLSHCMLETSDRVIESEWVLLFQGRRTGDNLL